MDQDQKRNRVYGRTMNILKSFLKEHIGMICIYLGFIGVFQIVFYLYNIREDAVNYAFLLSTLWLLLYGALSFIRYRRHYLKIMLNTKRADGMEFDLPDPKGAPEAGYQRIIETLVNQKKEQESKERISRQEMMDYYGMWVHQIKTPIAALGILLQSWDEESIRKRNMQMEVFKIEQYVEMVLSYLRMEDLSSDLAFAEYSLDAVVKQAVRKYKKMFIMKKISLQYDLTDRTVITDEKWLVFVVEQILSNALKYTKEGRIWIHMDERRGQGVLVIEDTGIGIRAEDLPRVFERGFTGYNGRNDKKSTGIGLYLCKKIMDKLGHEIWLESEPGLGTRAYLSLGRKRESYNNVR